MPDGSRTFVRGVRTDKRFRARSRAIYHGELFDPIPPSKKWPFPSALSLGKKDRDRDGYYPRKSPATRSTREHLLEELRSERSAREKLEERLEALECKASLIDKEEALISDDRKWALNAEREKLRILEYNERSAPIKKAKEEAEQFEREVNALATPEAIANNMEVLRDIQEARARNLKYGLTDSSQDKASLDLEKQYKWDKDKASLEEQYKWDKPQDKASESIPDTYPDKGVKPSKRGKKDRDRWDYPLTRGPPR